MMLNAAEDYVALGPWGGDLTVGDPFDYRPQGIISHIVIGYRDSWLDSLTFTSKNSDGSISSSPMFGKPSTSEPKISRTYTVSLAPEEYIVGLDIAFFSAGYIDYLLITTTRRVHGPFGSNNGTKFSIPIKDSHVVGFFGRSSGPIYSLGVYVSNANVIEANKVVKSWTYLPQGLVKKILIAHGDVINSLVFVSKTNEGVATSSMRFGGTGGTTAEVPISVGEYITGIDMMTGDYSGQKVINLVTIHTNVKTYGPFGKGKGSGTSILIKKGSDVGFYGLAGMFLNTIGTFEVTQPNSSGHDDKDDKTNVKPDPIVEKTMCPCKKGSTGSDFAIGEILLDINLNLELED